MEVDCDSNLIVQCLHALFKSRNMTRVGMEVTIKFARPMQKNASRCGTFKLEEATLSSLPPRAPYDANQIHRTFCPLC